MLSLYHLFVPPTHTLYIFNTHKACVLNYTAIMRRQYKWLLFFSQIHPDTLARNAGLYFSGLLHNVYHADDSKMGLQFEKALGQSCMWNDFGDFDVLESPPTLASVNTTPSNCSANGLASMAAIKQQAYVALKQNKAKSDGRRGGFGVWS